MFEKLLSKASPTGSYVALDLETSGVDKDKDRIIEIGCIKFSPLTKKTEKLSILINPKLEISDFIKELTGISQEELDGSPIFEEVSDKIKNFLVDDNGLQHSVIAHNAPFDIGFLQRNGIDVSGSVFDTYDLAFTLISDSGYSLQDLASDFNIDSGTAHRALSDAETTMNLFLILSEKLYELSYEKIIRLSKFNYVFEPPYHFAPSVLSDLFSKTVKKRKVVIKDQEQSNQNKFEKFDTSEFDISADKIFSKDGVLSNVLENYEKRSNQEQMFKHVEKAIKDKENLVIEAYPGTGKTLSYLISAAKYILESKKAGNLNPRVIVSTNSISLQNQIINKDWPIVCSLLEKMGISHEEINIKILKGRSNYLCRSKSDEFIPRNINELRVFAKSALWLSNENSGDRSHVNFKGLENFFYRISAEGSKQCVYNYPDCFLRQAREDAQDSDILIVNHSLAITGMNSEKEYIPPHDVFIIDEGHHLEDVATSIFGFYIHELEFLGIFKDLVDENNSLNQLNALFNKNKNDYSLGSINVENIIKMLGEIKSDLILIRESAINLFESFTETLGIYLKDKFNDRTLRLKTNEELINTDLWVKLNNNISELLKKWESTRLLIQEIEGFFEGANEILLRSETSFELIEDYSSKIHMALVEKPETDVFWLETDRNFERISINGAPIRVSEKLANILFNSEGSTIITGATLGEGGSFQNFKNSIGFYEGLSVPKMSPSFDYSSSALFTVVSDITSPNNNGYIEDISKAIINISQNVKDRILVLFTSYSALNSVRKQIQEPLKEIDMRMISQGVNGPAEKIVKSLENAKEIVALGTGPMWEGVDFQKAPLKVVIVPRLPFSVPTHPIFEARSEQYIQPFIEFAVPDAVKKFQQGFGRLIRSNKDFGAFVVLDNRIISKRYGQDFVESIPGYDWLETGSNNLGQKIKSWIDQK